MDRQMDRQMHRVILYDLVSYIDFSKLLKEAKNG